MKKAIVIGANSYIARNLIAAAHDRDDIEITALYDRQNQHADDVPGYRQIDILDANTYETIDLNTGLIFFFAGKTGTAVGFDEYETFIDVNEKGFLNLLSAYRNQNSNAKIIYPSTRLVYKGREGKLKEDSEKEFKTIYAINKYACEQYLKIYASLYGVEYGIFRICVPYGTLVSNAASYGTAEFMIERARNKESITLFGNGSMRRTLTYIGDICETLIYGGLSEHCKNDVYNIGGEDYSLHDMAVLIAEKFNVPVEFIEWQEAALKMESGDTVFESGKLDGLLDYKHRMRFKEWILRED